jgi:hypothetical protein
MGGDFFSFFRRHFRENVSEFRIFVLDMVEIGFAKLKNFAICQSSNGGRTFFPQNQGEISEVVSVFQCTISGRTVIGGNFNLPPADEINFFATSPSRAI